MGRIRSHKTGTITLTGATDTQTLSNVTGEVKRVAINPSGDSTDFKVRYDVGGVTIYMLGATGSSVTLTGADSFVPVDTKCGTDGSDLATGANIHENHVLDNATVTIEVSSGAADETYEVTLVVEE